MFDILKDRYGAVMTLEQLAATLRRRPEGLRMALLKPKSEWAHRLNSHKFYIGRRMYFPTEAVAHLLDSGFELQGGRDGKENFN
ncbi:MULTISPECIES: hypothetical protein [Burkholderia]|uniref:hypothetical protein n=1 Tax=Burkholderia cepacia complex TaxID=87882 RepID=UPI0024B6DEC9|nr:hypothetical protein [Burkholderia cenocepacia]MDI9696176.1 hypothetical protein [Burkholderia cenocepacia]